MSELRADEEASFRIDGEDASRAEARPAHANAFGQGHGPCLGGNRDETVVGHCNAQRTEPVAVECRSGDTPIREAEPRRAVPRLAEKRAVAVEVPHLRREAWVVLPRWWDE